MKLRASPDQGGALFKLGDTGKPWFPIQTHDAPSRPFLGAFWVHRVFYQFASEGGVPSGDHVFPIIMFSDIIIKT